MGAHTFFFYIPPSAQRKNKKDLIIMGLFNKNVNAGGNRNIIESIQRGNDTGTLIYLDSQQDFNTNSIITVAPNEQVIFIKNGEFYGVLPSGRHEVRTENYPVLSRIRNVLSGGVSTFTCQVYHVQTNEQKVDWGTSAPIEIQDFFLGGGEIGVPTLIRGAAAFRVRFNINEDDDASKNVFMHLMGDKSTYTVTDLGILFEAEIAQKISSVVGKTLETISVQRSINAISSQLEDFSIELKPKFDNVFVKYGLELVDFSFYNLNIEETETRQEYLRRRIGAANVSNPNYNLAFQQEAMKDAVNNQSAGNIAGAGIGLSMGMAMGNAFSQMMNPQQQPQHQPTATQPDPMESLKKMKQMLDAGLIKQEQYDSKVAEIMSRL